MSKGRASPEARRYILSLMDRAIMTPDTSGMSIEFDIVERWSHAKACEVYALVRFDYGELGAAEWTVPIVYPRLGLNLESDEEIGEHLRTIHGHLHPQRHQAWRDEQQAFWAGKKDGVTKAVFDAMAEDFAWMPYTGCPRPTTPPAA